MSLNAFNIWAWALSAEKQRKNIDIYVENND